MTYLEVVGSWQNTKSSVNVSKRYTASVRILSASNNNKSLLYLYPQRTRRYLPEIYQLFLILSLVQSYYKFCQKELQPCRFLKLQSSKIALPTNI